MSSQAEFAIEHNVELNEITIIELSAAEIKELEKTRKVALELSDAEQIEIQTKLAERQAILDRLGLNANEAALLLS
jgi:hypothetical protein